MNHDQYKEWVQLSVYDELNADEREVLVVHLRTCDECRDEHARLERLNNLLNRTGKWEPDDQLLKEARLELRAALRFEQNRKAKWSPLFEFVESFFTPRVSYAFGGAALLVVGACIGFYVLPRETQQGIFNSAPEGTTASFVQGEARISNVRFANTPHPDGDIEFSFDAITPVHIKGSVNDERVQKVLTHALLNEDNPGVRLRSVNAIASQAEQPRLMQDQSIKNALLKALRSDDNPAVRKEALRALQKFSFDDEIKKAFLNVLMHDNNSGIRIAVINILDSTKIDGKPLDQEVLDVLKQRMKADNNNYIRIRAKEALEEGKQ